jgi:hypothetical protein
MRSAAPIVRAAIGRPLARRPALALATFAPRLLSSAPVSTHPTLAPGRQNKEPAAAAAAAAYGAPFTNSVFFAPVAAAEAAGTNAVVYELRIAVPGQATAAVRAAGTDPLLSLLRDVRAATGARKASLLLNGGGRVTEASLLAQHVQQQQQQQREGSGGAAASSSSSAMASSSSAPQQQQQTVLVSSLLGNTVELDLDGVRWSINLGERLGSEAGAAIRQGRAIMYAVGGVIAVAASATVLFLRDAMRDESR